MKELLPCGLPDDVLPYAGVMQQVLFHYMRTCPDRKCKTAV